MYFCFFSALNFTDGAGINSVRRCVRGVPYNIVDAVKIYLYDVRSFVEDTRAERKKLRQNLS